MLQPVRTKWRKAHKGRIHGTASRANFINYGAYSQTLKDLHLKVEAQEKKINSVDIITNELGHLKGSINEIKNDLKVEFADIKIDIREIKQKIR